MTERIGGRVEIQLQEDGRDSEYFSLYAEETEAGFLSELSETINKEGYITANR